MVAWLLSLVVGLVLGGPPLLAAQGEPLVYAPYQFRQALPPSTQSQGIPSQLFGSWRTITPVVDQGLRQVFLSIDIHPDRLVFRPNCRYLDGSSLVGQFSSRAHITGDTIHVLDKAGDVVTAGTNVCQVSITPMAVPYVVRGREVWLAFDGRWIDFARQGG